MKTPDFIKISNPFPILMIYACTNTYIISLPNGRVCVKRSIVLLLHRSTCGFTIKNFTATFLAPFT